MDASAGLNHASAPDVSVVVPVYDNAATLSELALRLGQVLAARGTSHELILVDDASTDDSLTVARGLADRDARIRVVSLERNLGQNRALLAGLGAASADRVVIMDADLQDPPEALPELLKASAEGYDAVFAGRRGVYQSRGRMLTSWFYKGLMSCLCGLPRGAGLFVALRRDLVQELVESPELPWLLPRIGLSGRKLASVPVRRTARPVGSSAYSSIGRLRAASGPLGYALRQRLLSVPALSLAACWALAFATHAAMRMDQPFGLGDEGFRYVLSRAWAHGADLFVEFQPLYPIGQYAFYGSWMKLLGDELWVLRLARACLGGLAAACLLATLRRLAPLGVAWSVVFAFVVVVPPQAKVLATCTVLLLGMGLAHGRPSRFRLFVAGVAAGALAGWREDAAVLALAIGCATAWLRRKPREAILLAPAVLLGFMPWVAIELVRGDAGAFVGHVASRLTFLVARLWQPSEVQWRWPLQTARTAQEALHLAMPLLVVLPVVVYGLLLWRQAYRLRRGDEVERPLLAAVCLGFAYLPQFVWERPDLPHFIYHLPVLLVVTTTAAMALLPPRRRLLFAVVPLLLGLSVLVASPAPPMLVDYPVTGERYGLRLHRLPPWAPLERESAETMIVLGWGAGWYAVEGMEPGTRFLSTFGRHVGDPRSRAELEADLARPNNRWVIIDRPVGAPPDVLTTVSEQYCPRHRWGRFRLLERCH